jgi:hypothetical protein
LINKYIAYTIPTMPEVRWNPEKEKWSITNRSISFEDVVWAIENNHIEDIIPHHNPRKYPNQLIIYYRKDNYIYTCPCVKEPDGTLFLKTIYPSRKAVKQYLKGK